PSPRLERPHLVSRPARLPDRPPQRQRRPRGHLMTAPATPVLVNGVEISAEAILSEMQYHPAPSATAARHEAARALVVRELLLQAAEKLGISEPEPLHTGEGTAETREEALIRTVIAREVKTPEPD